jgi:hypothetical protein
MSMNKLTHYGAALAATAVLGTLAAPAGAAVLGISGVTGVNASCPVNRCFTLVARSGAIVTGDGNSLPTWGYSPLTAPVAGEPVMQYPGPTLIVNQGERVRVTLTNELPINASILFPGQASVVANGGVAGEFTREVAKGGGAVTYTFVASQPGTFMYQSGTRPELEVEMGMLGALIVRPTGFNAATAANRIAYYSATAAVRNSTEFDREYLYLLTEMDRTAHERVGEVEIALKQALLTNPLATFDSVLATGMPALPGGEPWLDPAAFHSTLWFMNGRNGPDTMLAPTVEWLPTQPYNSMTRMHPGDRVLMRIIGGGRDIHPFHHHGNNAWVIARDAKLFQSTAVTVPAYPDFTGITTLQNLARTLPDRAVSNFTIQIHPGSTYDAIFTWTGKGLGWDAYGHRDPDGAGNLPCPAAEPFEYLTDHCRTFTQSAGGPLPVTLPEQQALAFGGFYSGSPFLGTGQALPPLQGGLNPNSGFTFMWHSHTERELTNDDIFPGGMMTMLLIEAPSVTIVE